MRDSGTPVRFSLASIAFGALLAACSASSETPKRTNPGGDGPLVGQTTGTRGPGVPEFWVRPGFRVTLVASGLAEARFLELDDKGTLYVSLPNEGKILSLRLVDGVYKQVAEFVKDKPTVHGMCFADGWLWFTQSGAVYKARDTKGNGVADEVVNVIPEGSLPKGGGHWWRSILVGPDALYTGIGDTGNITDLTATEREKIYRFDKQGGSKHMFSSGIRNTEKLRFRPGTQEIWGCDHGSDWFGAPLGDKQGRQPITDDNPPDEINHYVDGGFYGHPFIVGMRVPRIEYQSRPDIVELAEKTIVPEWCLPAHFAPNAFTFLAKDYFPGAKGDMFVACHGSWNHSTLVGYCVDHVFFDKATGHPYGAQKVVGTLGADGRTVLGRPCDCVEAADGSVLFSCDDTRSIYRITNVGAK